VAALHDAEVDGSKLFVCRAQKKAEREKFLRDRFEQIKQERAKKYQGTNLYLKNLSDEATEEQVNTEFGKYGPITSTKIMFDDATGRSRGFGFVCFSNAEDASRAIAEMNGKLFQGKPLYVAIAQRKEQRRQMLEMARAKQMMAAGMYAPGAPIFYPPPAGMQGRPGAPGFMYPPQMMPGMRFPGGRPPYPLPAGQMPPPGYALVPAQVPMGQPRGPRGPRPQGAPQQGQQGPRQGAPRQGAPQGAPQQARQGAPQNRGGKQEAVLPGGTEPLTLATLVTAPPEMQKQLIGERLYPLIASQQPELAGKITGMLLEMDNAELLELLDNTEARTSKIVEAVRVLQEAGATDA
jgi:polyadenylate-binding protein